MTFDEAAAKANAFTLSLLKAARVKVRLVGAGKVVGVDAPAKWVAVIDAFNMALTAALAGEDLPQIQGEL